jgi:cytochrome c-type biogenesis protein CcmE
MSENEEVDDVTSDAGEVIEEPLGEEAPEEIKRPRKRRLSSNKIKILIVVAIISVALVIVLWGATPPEYISLEELMENSSSYTGKDVTVRGKVGNWTGGQNFTMVDAKNESIAIQVVHDGPIPEGFAEEKDVVVEGRLENRASGLTLITTEIQVGCPSKY